MPWEKCSSTGWLGLLCLYSFLNDLNGVGNVVDHDPADLAAAFAVDGPVKLLFGLEDDVVGVGKDNILSLEILLRHIHNQRGGIHGGLGSADEQELEHSVV